MFKLMVLATVAAVVNAQSNQYLPPKNGYPAPSQPGRGLPAPPPRPAAPRPPAPQNRPPQSQADHVHEPGMPYDFQYAVKDQPSQNDFSHNAASDGDVVKGEYRVAMPDGRTQIVKYTADWKNGYNAEVTYEGEARFPDQPSGGSKGGFQGY
ncbi:pro-resilin-like [Culicoides brevitarsis]|uniref:pro-resilin-like n=1 Tax=Culicoides brevitarsis TaxID=469753 RepID=UPI00307B7001